MQNIVKMRLYFRRKYYFSGTIQNTSFMPLKTYFIVLLLFLSSLPSRAMAQGQDEILVQKKGFGFAYFHNGRQISKNELLHILDSDPGAKRELQKGFRNELPAAVLSYAGGLLISYPLGKQVAGGEANWLVSGAGSGLLTFSIPFAGAKMKREHEAIYVYNGGMQYAARPRTDLRLGYAYNRATVVLSF
jgi:hypothetical protein